jgi:hypothetical protein
VQYPSLKSCVRYCTGCVVVAAVACTLIGSVQAVQVHSLNACRIATLRCASAPENARRPPKFAAKPVHLKGAERTASSASRGKMRVRAWRVRWAPAWQSAAKSILPTAIRCPAPASAISKSAVSVRSRRIALAFAAGGRVARRVAAAFLRHTAPYGVATDGNVHTKSGANRDIAPGTVPRAVFRLM